MGKSDTEARFNGHRSPHGIEGQQAGDFLEKVWSHSGTKQRQRTRVLELLW